MVTKTVWALAPIIKPLYRLVIPVRGFARTVTRQKDTLLVVLALPIACPIGAARSSWMEGRAGAACRWAGLHSGDLPSPVWTALPPPSAVHPVPLSLGQGLPFSLH